MLLTHGRDCSQVSKGLDQHKQRCNKDLEEEVTTTTTGKKLMNSFSQAQEQLPHCTTINEEAGDK